MSIIVYLCEILISCGICGMRSGNVNVPYQLKEPMRAGEAHDGEGGQMKGVSLRQGTKRSVIAIKDSA